MCEFIIINENKCFCFDMNLLLPFLNPFTLPTLPSHQDAMCHRAYAAQQITTAGRHDSHTNSISELKVSHGNSISELKAALADHQSQLQALTVQSTPLLGTALQGSSAAGDMCVADNECSSGFCINKPYAFCVDDPDFPDGHACQSDAACASKFCHNGNCKQLAGPYERCLEDIECRSGKCDELYTRYGSIHQCQ